MPTKTNGRPRIYPWDRWFRDARAAVIELRRGRDYRVGTANMIQQVRNVAARMGNHISVEEIDGGFTLINHGARRPRARKAGAA